MARRATRRHESQCSSNRRTVILSEAKDLRFRLLGVTFKGAGVFRPLIRLFFM